MALVESCAGELPGLAFVGRAGVGAGFLRLDGEVAAQAAAVARLRQSPSLAHVLLLGATPALKGLVDAWGDRVPWSQPLDALKLALDPAGILGAGRGPL